MWRHVTMAARFLDHNKTELKRDGGDGNEKEKKQ